MSHSLRPVPAAVSLLFISVLSACGGGSDATDAAATPPTLTLSGHVMGNGPIKNAVVCLDLNANAACDADEPAAAKTGADGAYSLTVDTAKVTQAQVSAAALIAPQVPGTLDDGKATIDMAEPTATNTTRAFVLRQVAGKAGQINPLTTLVATGVAGGMTEAQARDNVVLQLGLASAARIDDYQSDPAVSAAAFGDSARMAAQVLADALEAGAPIAVGDQTAADPASPGDLRSLSFTGTGDFRYLDFLRQDKAAGVAGRKLTDNRVGKSAGTALPSSTLYNQAYLTPQGWLRCDATVPIATTLGNPVRSVFCNTRVNFAYGVVSDVSGQAMADVVTQQASQAGNVFNAGGSNTALLAALGNTRFPADSSFNAATSVSVTRPIFINSLSTDGRPQAEATTLEQLIAAKPAGAVNLSNSSGSLSLGISSGPLKNLRVAFTGTTDAVSGTVQFYECDLNAAGTVASNCVTTQTGTYKIETVHGVRVMRFAGHAETTMTNTRLYVEVKASQQANTVTSGDWVYAAREIKPGNHAESVSVSNRLTAVGWQALKTQLGI
jgi:hypothetical protein